MDKNEMTAVIAVVISSVMFGALGVCTRYFHDDCGLSSIEIVLIRLTVSALALFIILALFDRAKLKIRKKDIPFMAFFGIFKFLTDMSFFYAQNNISLCLATLLQMTSPFFVMIISLFIFRERITLSKLFAMGVGAMGCVLVTNVLFGRLNANAEGIIAAIFSGLCFSLFFIGNKAAIDRGIRPVTMLLVTTVVADVIAVPFSDLGRTLEAVSTPAGLGMALAFGVLMTLIPYYLLTWSSLYLGPTVLSMISTLEVVAAAVVGYMLFNETLDIPHVIGITLVILSIVLINVRIRIGYFRRMEKYVPLLVRRGMVPERVRQYYERH